MIYRAMPQLSDPGFRRAFYARWGFENAVISARTRRAEYPDFTQLLSIKAAAGGAEDYFIDGRRMSVDDDTFAIINDERTYASRIDSLQPVHSFSIFFDRHLTAQTLHSLLRAKQVLDESTDASKLPVEFSERLYEHDNFVSPVLRQIRRAVDGGVVDDTWLEEQLILLLARMVKLHHQHLRCEAAVPSKKPATRRELQRRLSLGVDFIQTQYRDPLRLKDIAAAAHLSPFHFLRVFKSVYKMTPSEYVNRKRVRAALRLLQHSRWSMDTIAQQVGFGSRTTLYRHLKAQCPLQRASIKRAVTSAERTPVPHR